MFRVDNKDSKILIQKALSTMFILIQLVLLFMIHGIMVMIIGMVDQKNKLCYISCQEHYGSSPFSRTQARR